MTTSIEEALRSSAVLGDTLKDLQTHLLAVALDGDHMSLGAAKATTAYVAAAEAERDRLKMELVAEVVRREEANAYGDAEHDRALAAEAKCDALREAAIGAAAALAAAISLLERTPKATKAAPSDRMFDQMLSDYRAALEVTRRAFTQELQNA